MGKRTGTPGTAEVSKQAGVCGGKATLGATRVRVNNVVFMHKQGQAVEEIQEAYPDLSKEQVEAALAYYRENAAEIEAELERDEAFEEHFERLAAEYRARSGRLPARGPRGGPG